MEAVVNIKAIIETAVYVDDLRAAETFYRTVLGLRVIGKEPGPRSRPPGRARRAPRHPAWPLPP